MNIYVGTYKQAVRRPYIPAAWRLHAVLSLEKMALPEFKQQNRPCNMFYQLERAATAPGGRPCCLGTAWTAWGGLKCRNTRNSFHSAKERRGRGEGGGLQGQGFCTSFMKREIQASWLLSWRSGVLTCIEMAIRLPATCHREVAVCWHVHIGMATRLPATCHREAAVCWHV